MSKIRARLDGLACNLMDTIDKIASADFDNLPLEEKQLILNRANAIKSLGDVVVKAAAIDCKHRELDQIENKPLKPLPINGKTLQIGSENEAV